MSTTNNASLLRILWKILERYTVPPEPLFREMGLDPALMQTPGGRYRLDSIDALWREAAKRIADPCFGLTAADLWHPSNLGAMGYAMLASHSLRSALERLERYHRVLSDDLFVRLDDTPGGLMTTLLFSKAEQDIPERHDAELAVILSICRVNYVDDLAPLSVTVTHAEPACASRFFAFFRCPVEFSSDRNSLTLPAAAVDRYLPGADHQLAELSDRIMVDYLARLDDAHVPQRVKGVIIEQLPSGRVTDERVAHELGMSPRKLQRQLQAADTTFSSLLNEVREDLARTYLTEPEISLTEIAFLLGFSESSAFSRAFKRWTGMTPSAFRRAA